MSSMAGVGRLAGIRSKGVTVGRGGGRAGANRPRVLRTTSVELRRETEKTADEYFPGFIGSLIN